MSSNFPPGVSESMIPGNTPEDEQFEKVLEWISGLGLDPYQIQDAMIAFLEKLGRKEEPPLSPVDDWPEDGK